jgi:hypothetical protein
MIRLPGGSIRERMYLTDYEWLTAMNLCHRCKSSKPAPERKFCFDCLDKIREINARNYDPDKAKAYQTRRREIYRQKKEAGICVKCRKPATHKIFCYEHYIVSKRNGQKQALRKRNERQDRKTVGGI